MGLRVSIFKSGGQDFSNGGVSAFMDEGVIVNIAGPSEPDYVRVAPLLLLPGNVKGLAKVVPATETQDGEWVPANSTPPSDGSSRPLGPFMGGCYVACCDSRFDEAVEEITGMKFNGAVPLHDRYETTQQYAELSAD